MNKLETIEHASNGFSFGQIKRKHRRASLSGFMGDLSDGKLVIGGDIEDMSLGGFKITDIPRSFTGEKFTYTAIVSGGGKHYRLLVKPCWRKEGAGTEKTEIGFKIIDAPWDWVEFIMNEIQEFDYEDSFGFRA